MKIITTTLTAIALAMPAYADTVKATVSRVDPIYHNTTINTPRNICQDVQVPIYGNVQRRSSDGEVLSGAIIGGVIGNQFGNGQGKDIMTVLGAIMGANSQQGGKTSQVVTGYRLEQQCQTVYASTTERTLKHYKIYFTWNGHEGTAMTYNEYQVGNSIPVEVSLRAK